MASYYYLGAQLPYLVYGQDPPMSPEAFKTLAVQHMGASATALLDYCTLDPEPLVPEIPEGEGDAASAAISGTSGEQSYASPSKKLSSDFINSWKEWERSLRLNLAKGRALKLKREISIEAPDGPSDAIAAANNALLIESPLEAELFLDKARWDFIDGLQGVSVFSENAMYAYMLKLLLMERRNVFNAEEGFKEYKELYEAILSSGNYVNDLESA